MIWPDSIPVTEANLLNMHHGLPDDAIIILTPKQWRQMCEVIVHADDIELEKRTGHGTSNTLAFTYKFTGTRRYLVTGRNPVVIAIDKIRKEHGL